MNFSKHIKVLNTVKLFYATYPYRICFQVDETKLITSNVSRGWYGRNTYGNLRSLRNDLKRKIIEGLPDSLECRFREEGLGVTLYLSDEVVFNDLVSRLSKDIVEVTVPANEAHKQVMEDNHRIRVRHKLFYDTYRFKVIIKNTWSERFTDYEKIKEWLEHMDNPGDNRWMVNTSLRRIFTYLDKGIPIDRIRTNWGSFSVYLNDDQDVMMLQLWLNKHYEGAEKVVLISEL